MNLLAEALLKASNISSNSIKLSFAGWDTDCTTKTSLPLTFSSIFTQLSPSENCLMIDLPRGKPNIEEISERGFLHVWGFKTTLSKNPDEEHILFGDLISRRPDLVEMIVECVSKNTEIANTVNI